MILFVQIDGSVTVHVCQFFNLVFDIVYCELNKVFENRSVLNGTFSSQRFWLSMSDLFSLKITE